MLTAPRVRLLEALCRHVRLATDEQAATLMGHDAGRAAAFTRQLADLVAKNFLRRHRVIARRATPLTEPLLAWQPGQPRPDFAALAWRLDRRWDVPPRVVPVYRAGPAARRVFGSGTCAGGLNLAALGHDLACTDLLLAFAASRPERVRHWVGEDLRKAGLQHGEKLPDVVLYGDDGRPYLMCEVAGAYPESRLSALHDHAATVLTLPYELW